MKKIAIVLFVVAAALTACGKKKDAATPATGGAGSAGSDMGSGAMGSGM